MPARRRPLGALGRGRTERLGIPIVGIAVLLLLAVPSVDGRPIGMPNPAAARAPLAPGPSVDSPAGALFVAPDGNDRNACTFAAPCRQIGPALLRATAGTIISVAPGAYRAVDIDGMVGLASEPIRIQASGPNVVLRAGTDPADRNDSLRIVDSAFVTVQGLSASGATGADLLIEGSHDVTVANGSFDSARTAGMLIEDSTQVGLLDDRVSGTMAGPGIEVRGPASGVTIDGGLIARNQGPGVRVVPGPANGDPAGVTDLTLEATILRANLATSSAAVVLEDVQGSTLANDLLYANLGGGIELAGSAGAAGPRDDLIAYTTVLLASSGRWALSLANTSGSITVEDNILDRAGSLPTGIAYGASSDAAHTMSGHNILGEVRPALGSAAVPLAIWQGEGYETGSFTAPPPTLFVNPRGDDFDLLPTSAAIGRGIAIPQIATDLNGASRPVTGPTDIGCFELGPSGPAPLAVTIAAADPSGAAPFAARLTAESTGGVAPYTYLWNFGDGSSAGGTEVDHTYAAPGVYTVQLVGSDGRGDRGVAYLNLTVLAPGGTGYPVTFRPVDLPASLSWSIGVAGSPISGTGAITLAGVPAGVLVVTVPSVVETAPYLRWTTASALEVNVTGPVSVPVDFTPYVFVAVNSTAPGGTVSPGSGWWPDGASIDLTATARSGYVFDGWSGRGSDSYTGAQPSDQLVLAASITEVAHFTAAAPATTIGPITRATGTFVWPTFSADWAIVAISALVLGLIGVTNYRVQLGRRLFRAGAAGTPITFPAPWMESIAPTPPAPSPAPPPWLESP